MLDKDLDFVYDSEEILFELMRSKVEGNSVAIKASHLGDEPIITAVEDIMVQDGQTIVVLKPYDLTGYILPSYKIDISNITGIYKFSTAFRNPFHDNIDKSKTWHF